MRSLCPAGKSPAGPHTFQTQAIDTAGNVDQTPATQTWNIQRYQDIY